jgi:hypothetical protein
MSVAHLMDAYISRYQYLDAGHWAGTGGGGFCMHSDWVVGFFVNFYNIAHRRDNAHYNPSFPNNLLQGYLGSQQYAGKQTAAVKARYGQCAHDRNEKCTSSAHICHYVTPERMQTLHHQGQQQQQQQQQQQHTATEKSSPKVTVVNMEELAAT